MTQKTFPLPPKQVRLRRREQRARQGDGGREQRRQLRSLVGQAKMSGLGQDDLLNLILSSRMQ